MVPINWFSNKRRNHILALGFFSILALSIAYFTLTPNPGVLLTSNDKIDHVLSFSALIFPAAFLYRHALYWLVPFAIIFGGAIEIIQPYVNRKGELPDFWADVVGVFLGLCFGLLLRYYYDQKLNN